MIRLSSASLAESAFLRFATARAGLHRCQRARPVRLCVSVPEKAQACLITAYMLPRADCMHRSPVPPNHLPAQYPLSASVNIHPFPPACYGSTLVPTDGHNTTGPGVGRHRSRTLESLSLKGKVREATPSQPRSRAWSRMPACSRAGIWPSCFSFCRSASSLAPPAVWAT
jgi:hypothetical protein